MERVLQEETRLGDNGRDVVLRAESLEKSFRLRGGTSGWRVLRAVNGVSLQLRRGRVTALVGESGCGKSTVARLVARLYPLNAGRIWLDKRLVSGDSERVRRRYAGHVQIILQDPFASLNASYSVRHHIARPLVLHRGRHWRRADLDAEIVRLLEEVDLVPGWDFIHRYPHELSGGQRQRVSIARALAVQPEVLLADEPVSMLDVSIRLGVLRLLDRLVKERQLAMLYITHDIASARYFASEIAVMYAGEVVEQGPSEEVTQSPRHPYTQLLLAAVPNPERAVSGGPKLVTAGEPPDLANLPSGCRFHPRCVFAGQRCRSALPPVVQLAASHWARCFLFDQGGVGEPLATRTRRGEEEQLAPPPNQVEVGTARGVPDDARGALQSSNWWDGTQGLFENGEK
jgi:peptide/nickel transport system ATP-binding protein